jgi:beta-glucanase (GH16 family)
MRTIRRAFFFLLLTAGCFFVSGCNRSVPDPGAAFVPKGMKLVWADEFTHDGAPDPAKWDYSLGGNGWGNGEVQTYTNKRENSVVSRGNLVITAVNSGGMWTSARLKTQYLADWTYGYIEVRAQLPRGVGTWPAIWMMPQGDIYGGWPRSGEIDIMEAVGFDPGVVHTTIHTLSYNHKIGTQKTFFAPVKGALDGFHLYAIEWNPEYIQWFVDGKPFFRFANEHKTVAEWPFNIPYYLIMNLSIGGEWGGQKGIDPKMKKATMLVDYVRVYQ